MINQSHKLLNVSSTIFSTVFKSICVIYIASKISPSDFAEFINIFNFLLISGYIFSLEHHTEINRRLFRNSTRNKKEKYWKYYKAKIIKFNLIKSFVGIILFSILFDLESKIYPILFTIIFFELLLVDLIRFKLASSSWLESTLINNFKIFLFSIAGLIITYGEYSLINFLYPLVVINFLLVSYFINDWYKFIFAGLKTYLIDLISITKKSYKYFLISVIGYISPLVDKYIFFQLGLVSMVKDIVIVGIFSGLASTVSIYLINNPNQNRLLNQLEFKNFLELLKKSSLLFIFFSICMFFFILSYDSINNIFVFMPDINLDIFFELFIYSILIIILPTSSLISFYLYSKKQDNILLFFSIFEFLIKVIILSMVIVIGYFYCFLLLLLTHIFVMIIKLKYAKKITQNHS